LNLVIFWWIWKKGYMVCPCNSS